MPTQGPAQLHPGLTVHLAAQIQAIPDQRTHLA